MRIARSKPLTTLSLLGITGGFALATACGAPTTSPATPSPISSSSSAPSDATPAPVASAAHGNDAAAVSARFAAVRDAFTQQWLDNAPGSGRDLGIHAYDGKISDYSRAGIDKRMATIKKARAELAAFDTAELSPDERLDLEIAKQMIDVALFGAEDLDQPRKRPQFYEELFNVSAYADREYAPLDVRTARLVEHEEAALAAVPHIYENLTPPLSRVVAEVAAKNYAGFASYLRGDVAKRMGKAGDAALQARFAKANTALAKEAQKFSTWLAAQVKTGDDSHVLGVAKYTKLLAVQERLSMPLADFKKLGEENLQKNKKAYEELEKRVKPKRPKASELLALASKTVTDARAFLVAKKILTLPTEDTATVKETPPYARWNAASLEMSGPFDPARSAFYYITLPDASWPKKEQEDYVLTFGSLIATTVHEVYPGHFVQGRVIERAPTKLQKMSGSYSFVEGWAHYTEEMMLDEGFEAGDQTHIGQLEDALLRNCRFAVSLGIHTEGMTLEQGQARFVNDCHIAKPAAREQAIRGTFDPGYFAYTLGKLEIMALRDEAKTKLGPAFSLQKFHDALLSHGAPPVALIRERVLKDLESH